MKKQYYQIDYIDKNGLANYINTFHDIEEAKNNFNILTNALRCITRETYFVLDSYEYEIDENKDPVEDTDELTETILDGNLKKENK